MNIRCAWIALLLIGCTRKEDPIQNERETVKEVLFTDVQNFVGDSIDGDLDRMHLYHHGPEGRFGVDYTLCGTMSVWEKNGSSSTDHGSDNLFVITMRLGNKGRILGVSDLQFVDASPTAKTQKDSPVNMLCSNSAAPLPAKFEPPDNR